MSLVVSVIVTVGTVQYRCELRTVTPREPIWASCNTAHLRAVKASSRTTASLPTIRGRRCSVPTSAASPTSTSLTQKYAPVVQYLGLLFTVSRLRVRLNANTRVNQVKTGVNMHDFITVEREGSHFIFLCSKFTRSRLRLTVSINDISTEYYSVRRIEVGLPRTEYRRRI